VITSGIGAGFVTWVVFRVAQRRAREIHPLLWGPGINVVKALFGVR
jgi:xanthine/uracil/vitamin C permease (AzgA family)